MPRPYPLPVFVSSFLVAGAFTVRGLDSSTESSAFFESHIRPVLVEHCYECHSAGSKSVKGGLLLDTRAGIRRGGDSGPTVVPGDVENSLVLSALRQEEFEMPPDGRLPVSVVEHFEQWIRDGATDPRDGVGAAVAVETAELSHWAFQAIDPPLLAAPGDVSPIDAFVDQSLEEQGLVKNPEADRHALIRRASFDLLGLPPTHDEIQDFVTDRSPDAWPSLVDRLLASPRYGERQARHWLDVARYADTNGVDENMAHPNAWRYRNYVIRSFNQDKPYDQFLLEQIAGDLLPRAGDWRLERDRIVATGFLAMGPKMLAEQDKEKLLMDVVDEQIDVISKTILGLTVSCARCHDHKFDPVSQEDYYALAGIFRSTLTLANTNHVSRWVETTLPFPGNESLREDHRNALRQLELEIEEEKSRANPDSKALEKLSANLTELRRKGPSLPRGMAVRDGSATDLGVHIRGSHLHRRSNPTSRGVLSLFQDTIPDPTIPEETSGRLQFAQWLVTPNHPLTARVIVNRVWKTHFGVGLASSDSNFGLRGDPPTHPGLLDWLARDLIRNQWSLKRLHRLILLSKTWRRSSNTTHSSDSALRDPTNRYYWRQNRRRLEAEPIRDTLLFVTGGLDLTGRHVMGKLATNDSYYRGGSDRFDFPVRSIYLPVVRNRSYDMFTVFDVADPSVHVADRAVTTTPQQALFLMNSPLVREAAARLADEIWKGRNPGETFDPDPVFLRLYGRHVTPPEQEVIRKFLAADPDQFLPDQVQSLCRTLLGSNEMIFVD